MEKILHVGYINSLMPLTWSQTPEDPVNKLIYNENAGALRCKKVASFNA